MPPPGSSTVRDGAGAGAAPSSAGCVSWNELLEQAAEGTAVGARLNGTPWYTMLVRAVSSLPALGERVPDGAAPSSLDGSTPPASSALRPASASRLTPGRHARARSAGGRAEAGAARGWMKLGVRALLGRGGRSPASRRSASDAASGRGSSA